MKELPGTIEAYFFSCGGGLFIHPAATSAKRRSLCRTVTLKATRVDALATCFLGGRCCDRRDKSVGIYLRRAFTRRPISLPSLPPSIRISRSDVGGSRLCLRRLCPLSTAGSDRGHAEREPGEQDFADGGDDFAGLEQVQPERDRHRGRQVPRGRPRRAGEGGEGGLPVERRGQQRGPEGGVQSVPQQEGGRGEAGVPREEALLPLHGLREDVRKVVPPQSPPEGPHR